MNKCHAALIQIRNKYILRACCTQETPQQDYLDRVKEVNPWGYALFMGSFQGPYLVGDKRPEEGKLYLVVQDEIVFMAYVRSTIIQRLHWRVMLPKRNLYGEINWIVREMKNNDLYREIKE